MKYSNPVFDMGALGEVEQTYRQRLEQEPVDTSARLRLAWCLVMRAFHEAGQEAMLSQLRPTAESPDEQAANVSTSDKVVPELPEKSAHTLLRSCLKQAMMVLELSTSYEERREAEKLRTLVHISGGVEAIREADAESKSILTELTHDILHGRDDDTDNKKYHSPDLLA